MKLHLDLLVVIIFSVSSLLRADVIQVKKSNFEQVTKGKKFIMLYVVPPQGYCDTCLDLYPEFLTAADIFHKEKDIFFGKVSDSKLIDVLEVKLFPTVVYYEHGSASHQPLEGDISVDNLLSTVKEGMRGDFSHIKSRYTVQLTDKTFGECIENPNQHAFIIIHDKESASSMAKEMKIFEDLAATFKNDEMLLIGSINASKEIKLAGDFAVSRYPALYWYDKEDKTTRKRYGGRMDIDELITFINDQTHLDRNVGGELMVSAGRVPEMDSLLTLYMEDIMEGRSLGTIITEMEDLAKKVQINQQYATYYVSIVKKIKQIGRIDGIEEERDLHINQLSRGKLTAKEMDDLTRKRNIVNKFVDEVAMLLLEGDSDSVKVVKHEKQKKTTKLESVIDLDLHEEL